MSQSHLRVCVDVFRRVRHAGMRSAQRSGHYKRYLSIRSYYRLLIDVFLQLSSTPTTGAQEPLERLLSTEQRLLRALRLAAAVALRRQLFR